MAGLFGYASCGKNSQRKRVWEGHEFHSCRKCRKIDRGFSRCGLLFPPSEFFPTFQPHRTGVKERTELLNP